MIYLALAVLVGTILGLADGRRYKTKPVYDYTRPGTWFLVAAGFASWALVIATLV